MTISVSSSQITVAATGASQYAFPFVGVATNDISVLYTSTSGTITTVPNTAYYVTLNSAAVGQVWGVGGYVIPVTPSNYSTGSLTILRNLPFTQSAEISNQGNQYPIVTEKALDTLCMEIQQVAARTGSYRGVWATGNYYNFGDIVQDGANGAYTNNIYVCSQANTAGVWATDLASGYWALSISVSTLQPPGSFLPLSGGTISGNLIVSGNEVIGQSLTVNGSTYLGGLATCYNGLTASGTVSGSGFTSLFASPPAIGGTAPAAGAFTTLKTNGTQVIGIPSVTIYTSSSGTFTTPANCRMLRVRGVGGGGGGAGSASSGATGGGTGGNTTFGTSLLTANGGAGGTVNGAGGAGGTATLGGATGINLQGGGGTGAVNGGSVGGTGGNSAFGGGGPGVGGSSAAAGINGYANTGGGGSGGQGYTFSGAGGGAGGYFEAWITSPASTYAYAVGGAGTAGTGTATGGTGGSGIIIIEAF